MFSKYHTTSKKTFFLKDEGQLKLETCIISKSVNYTKGGKNRTTNFGFIHKVYNIRINRKLRAATRFFTIKKKKLSKLSVTMDLST